MEQRHCHKTLVDVFNEFCLNKPYEAKTKSEASKNESYAVPNNLLEKWIYTKYPHSTNFWAIRKNVS